ncbi:hypothetical protein DAEQUDRAFT_664957 [Daedalea quercina L-15889]|uniref:Tyrosine--tRNA ligase n=1 Tax=Daedalea quercina L-15889 TaxID=1314783 RepID=A0A165SJG5_9APHY|nr:hypothetical protein DAEQUDRAFT_664957 [Daedalea quercina L-15889]
MQHRCHVLRRLQVLKLRRACTAPSRPFHLKVDLLEDLKARELVADITRYEIASSIPASRLRCFRPEQLQKELKRQPQVVYSGVDPTAKYLHVGHLLPLLCLLHFQLRGHKVISLIGGATGLIGDPSGRSTERPLAAATVVEDNVRALSQAIQRFFAGALEYARNRLPSSKTDISAPDVRNNLDWFKGMGLLEFLRMVGIHHRVNNMVARESVKARLSSQQGISFTEFTYQLLQSYDFLRLHKDVGCNIQLGGSDQWGNIVAGIELIHHVNAASNPDGQPDAGFGIVTPLLTTSTGEKFGKSAGNAVSLDETVTNVLDFYQFFLRTADADVGRYLKTFTLLPVTEIDEVMETHRAAPETRTAQRLLAEEVTELIHGKDGVRKAHAATAVLYGGDFASVKASDVVEALDGLPVLHTLDETEVFGTPVPKLAVRCGIATSNGAARQLVAAKGLYVNNRPVTDAQLKLTIADLIDNRLIVLRAGRQKQAVIALQRH